MTPEQQEIERLRESLRKNMTGVPHWMSAASVQQVRQWRYAYRKAQKVADKKNPSTAELQTAINSIA